MHTDLPWPKVIFKLDDYIYLVAELVNFVMQQGRVGPLPVRSHMEDNEEGTGKDHSYRDIVKNMLGAPNWLTA